MVLQFYMFYHRCTMRMIEVQQTKGCKKEKDRKSLKQFIYFNAPMYFIIFPAQIFQHFNLTFESSTGPMTDDSFRWCQAVVVVVWETQHTGIWAKAVKDMGQGSRRIREMDHFFWMNPSFVWNHMDLTPYIYIYIHVYMDTSIPCMYRERYEWCLPKKICQCVSLMFDIFYMLACETSRITYHTKVSSGVFHLVSWLSFRWVSKSLGNFRWEFDGKHPGFLLGICISWYLWLFLWSIWSRLVFRSTPQLQWTWGGKMRCVSWLGTVQNFDVGKCDNPKNKIEENTFWSWVQYTLRLLFINISLLWS